MNNITENKTYWIWDSLQRKNKVHYLERGEGTDHILLLHGYGSHTCTWEDLIKPLTRAGYKVWVLDLLGFGYSDKPMDVTYNLELYQNQVIAFMQEMQIERADLIAHSMGAAIAIKMACDHHDKVNSLTLISAMAYPFQLPIGFRIAKRFPFLIKPFCGLAFIRSSRKQLVVNSVVACTPEKVEAAAEPYYLPNGPDVAFKVLQQFDDRLLIEMGKLINQIKQETLVIWGKDDPLIPAKHCGLFFRDIPHAEIFLLDRCGHIPHEEYPEETTCAILNFLNKKNPIG